MTKKNNFHAFSITYSRQIPLVKSTDDKKKTLSPAFSITYSRQIPLVKSTDEQNTTSRF